MAPKKVLIAGGAGFIGSHLTERFLEEGFEVHVVDNMITGNPENLASVEHHPHLTVIPSDVEEFRPPSPEYAYILHLASPASPVDFQALAYEITRCNSIGTYRLLDLAKQCGAVFLFASSSEVYGDPQVHPQTEESIGCVNPVGPRGPYDEGKRFGETITMTYHRKFGVDVRIARIFNTYGPRMRPHDGRVIPSFLTALLQNQPLPIHGDGQQTRSFCFVTDLVEALYRLATTPGLAGEIVNLGNPEEVTILELAERLQKVSGRKVGVKHLPRPQDDPSRRRPDITKAQKLLHWSPRVPLEVGLRKTWEWAKQHYPPEIPPTLETQRKSPQD